MRKRRIITALTMPFEHKNDIVASQPLFTQRVTQYALLSLGLLTGSLGVGMLGYKYLVGVKGWDDAFLNASMILTGMGPMIDADVKMTTVGKVFSGCYAIYSGIAFLSIMVIFFSPILHRFLHLMHVECAQDENNDATQTGDKED
jgi:hypothetical protein